MVLKIVRRIRRRKELGSDIGLGVGAVVGGGAALGTGLVRGGGAMGLTVGIVGGAAIGEVIGGRIQRRLKKRGR